MSTLDIVNIHKRFGEKQALAGVSFSIAEGEIIAVLGPSGCGKSTLLYTIAGLEPPDQGDILWQGHSLVDVPPHRRNFGLMFQDYALFPHRNVFDNVAFGLQMLQHAPAAQQQRVQETLALVGLPGFEKRDVNTLSGGEAQRVALARSLAPRPRLLMFDEPLGSLDRNLRERLAQDLRRILRESRQTAIYVTHDLEEAFMLADRVVLMNAGRVEQIGAPGELYRRPANLFAARFLGLDNLLPGRVVATPAGKQVETAAGLLPANPLAGGEAAPGEATVLVRPEAAQLKGQNLPQAGEHFELSGRVESVSFRGTTCEATVRVGEALLTFDFPSIVDLPAVGEKIELVFSLKDAIQIFR